MDGSGFIIARVTLITVRITPLYLYLGGFRFALEKLDSDTMGQGGYCRSLWHCCDASYRERSSGSSIITAAVSILNDDP